MKYYELYIKYKNKYLNLKNKIDGGLLVQDEEKLKKCKENNLFFPEICTDINYPCLTSLMRCQNKDSTSTKGIAEHLIDESIAKPLDKEIFAKSGDKITGHSLCKLFVWIYAEAVSK